MTDVTTFVPLGGDQLLLATGEVCKQFADETTSMAIRSDERQGGRTS